MDAMGEMECTNLANVCGDEVGNRVVSYFRQKHVKVYANENYIFAVLDILAKRFDSNDDDYQE